MGNYRRTRNTTRDGSGDWRPKLSAVDDQGNKSTYASQSGGNNMPRRFHYCVDHCFGFTAASQNPDPMDRMVAECESSCGE